MEKVIKTSRITVIYLVIALFVVIYSTVLYKLQFVDVDEDQAAVAGSTATTTAVSAARGSILDRNGVLLVSDRAVYNITISRSVLINQENPNEIVLKLIKAATQYGVNYTDTFPVTMSAPFAFSASQTSTQQSRLSSYLSYKPFNLDENISAPELISWMRDHYGIDYTLTAEEARLIIGIRYELEIRAIVNTTDYVFASDVDVDFVTYLLEQNLPGVNIESSSQREYYTKYAAHVLGNIGSMSGTEYQDTYKEQGYSYNALVGRSGVEYAFESYLHGTDGSITTYTDSNNAVTDVVVNSQAQAGDNVYLTIDIALQQVAEDALASTITQMNTERETSNATAASESDKQELAEGGAVVVIDVNSGEVLVNASYPTFDLANFNANYSTLIEDSLKPMWNRATQGTYNPGSTFKMVTALAALNSGLITQYTTINDEGKYTKYPSFQPNCWIYPGNHGLLNVVGALENSCNYFFYWLGDHLDISDIAAMASEFGLGSKTGIEIGEQAGVLATREYKKETLNEGWWTADTLMAAIGQSYNSFTPIQIANYIAAIANGGTLYSTSILKYVTSSDYSDIILRKEPEILNVIDDSNGYFSVIQSGMRAVATTGTAASIFKNYDIKVAAKTGTVQSDLSSTNNGVFVCYAPADDPQIAIAVVVEKGGSGSALANIAKSILTEYFSSDNISTTIYSDNSLIK
jgi:penicillin-binding protein 2